MRVGPVPPDLLVGGGVGLTEPLPFTAGHHAPPTECWSNAGIAHGDWVWADKGRMHCR